MIEVVDPTIGDFVANPASRRHAFLACVVTNHTIDYMAYPKKAGSLRQRLTNNSPALALVERVANAVKHVESGREQTALRASDTTARPPAYYDVSGALDVSIWDDPIGCVTIEDGHGRHQNLLRVVNEATKFLRDVINEKSA